MVAFAFTLSICISLNATRKVFLTIILMGFLKAKDTLNHVQEEEYLLKC